MDVQDLIDALRKENANKSVSSFKRAFTNLNAADRQSLLNKFLSCLTQEDPVSSKKLLPVLGIIVDGIEGEALPVLKQTMIVTVMLKRVKFCLQLCFFTLNLKLADSMEEEIFSTIVQLIAKLDLGNYEMAESMLKGFFRSYPNIMQKFVNYLLQRPTIDQLDRFQFCLLMMKNESLGVFEGLVKRFLELLSKKLSSAVSVQSELTDLKWAHFFQCLPLEFWADESESSLQSNILKAIRKAPESLSCFVVHVLKYLNPILRVDSFLLNLLPSILRMLKSEDYEVKFNGIQSVKFGIHRCCDVQKISLFYKGFYDALNGKNPGVATISIPQDHHKFAILTSIDSIFAVISTLDSPSLKKETLDLFFNYVEKERDIEVFPLHGHVLLAAIGSQIDSETLHTLLNGLSKVRSTTNGISLRSFYLIALTSLFYLDDLIVEDEMCSKLLSALDSIVKESVKRENVLNYDALISFAIMCRLFDSFPQFRGEKERLAKLVSVYPNFVFNETVKLQLWKWLIAKNHGDICSYFRFSRLSSSSPVPQMILQRAVVHSIAMISYSLRDLILERSQQVSLFNNYFARFGHLTCSESSKFLPLTLILTSTYANSPSQPFLQRYSSNLLVQISAQLMELLGQIYDHNQELLKSSSSESVNPQPRRITVDGILTCLTASIVVANETELPFLLTLIPLILSSPCVTSSQRHAASRLRELFKRQEHIKLLYLSNLTEVALHLSNGSINSGVHHRQCALIAAFSLSCSLDQTSAKLFISHFSNNLHQILKNTYISKFTPEDAEIYRDFEEVVQKRLETVAQQGKGEVVSIQSDLRDHSRKRRDGASDNAIWAEKIRKEKASKDLPSNKSQSSTSTELEVLVRTEISLLRAKIEKSVEETSFVFSAINFLHCLDSGLVIEAFLVLLQGSLLFNIFRFPASQDFSWHLVAPLKKLFSSDIGDVTMDLVASLRIATSEFTEGVEPPLCFQNLLQRFETYRLETDDSNRHSLLLALLLPMLNQLCLFGDKTVGGKVFQILQNLLPNLSQLVQNYPAAFKLVRSKLSEIITATLMLTSRFPSNNFGVEEFMLENCLEALPLAPEELSLLCSASILFNERTEVQLFSVELLCGLASVGGEEILGSDSHVDALLWISQYTNSENVSSLLQDLWKEKTLSLEAFQIITNFLETSERGVRVAAGKSYGDALTRSAAVAEEQFILLSLKYDEMLPAKLVKQLDTAIVDSKQSSKLLMKSKPKLSQVDTDQKRYCRESIALALRSICGSKVLSQSFVWTLLNFLIEKGVADSEADVRIIMTESAQVLMRSYGDRELGTLINFFEQVLERKPGKDEDITVYDSRHAASIILLGTLARHIQSLDNVLIKIVDMLIHSLQIPSESVQRSVSDCLLSICPNLKGTEYGTKVLETLLIRVLTGKTYGDRRGAAIALAALVKGYGLSALRQFNLISKLKDACSSGNLNSRQGALFAFEFLAERLTILFEPYVGGIVDILLACFSHSSDHVREAAAAATKVIMSKLTPHGIKQLLNPILSTLNTDTQWKSRQEAIKMLSIIVNCAPKQVAVSLPQIVSLLVRGTSDPHPKIKEAAKVALHGVSAVIRNPEIAGVGSTLLHALTDPANRTKDALEALLEIEFMHSIDPPSLALLMPILSRALKDRSADLKRKSAAITGNIIAMVNDSNALTGYVANLVVGLKDCLIDPTPDVRANGAKALGNLYNGLQNIEGSLKDILTWLFDTLQSEMSPVERSGAAQGLAEICGLCNDLAKRESLIERVLSLRNNFSPFAREGIMWFLSFLPSTLKEQAALYLDTSLPIILDGFHDEVDAVREVSIRAGKILITVLGLRHAVHIARILVTGLYKDDYKIRLYSSQLIGDLLLLLGDVKVGLNAFSEVDEGDDEGGEQLGATKILSRIRERLGKQLTDEVLASLYLVRSDFAVAVRQHALQIWKAIVANTPRTLIEIMPILIGIIVSHLSSVEEDLRLISGRCVGELVSKLGDRVLPEIIRPLEDGFQQSSEEARLGICTGLTEILTACSRKQAEDYIAVLIRTVHCALSDDAKEVSHQGAKAFMILYRLVGSVAVDQIVPVMIKDLASTTRDKAQKAKILRGLREIVCLKPREMLEYLLPLLLISPMTLPSAEALASILEVAGTYTYHHFHSIISLTIQELFSCESEQTDLAREKYQALRNLVITIVSSTDQTGLHQLVLELGRHVEHESNLKRRRWGCFFYELFFQSSSKAEYEEYLPLILKQLLSRITDSDLNVVMALKDCLTSMVSHIALEKFLPHVDFMRNCIASNISTARHKTGSQNIETSLQYFSLPKSLEPFLTLFLYGLVHGNTQAKEISAEIIGTLCSLALPEVLKPTLIKTVGPLIRILGERHPSTVKSAILTTIMLLLERGGPNLKPFAPQLQTTFIKCLSDPLREVRVKSAEALGLVISIHSLKVDLVLSELNSLIAQNDSTAIKISIFDAINKVLQRNGEKTSSQIMVKIKDSVVTNLFSEEESVRMSAARIFSNLVAFAEPLFVTDLTLDLLEIGKSASKELAPEKVMGSLLGLAYILQSAGIKGQEFREEVFSFISSLVDNKESIAMKTAISKVFEVLFSFPRFVGAGDRKPELRNAAQSAVHRFVPIVTTLMRVGESADIKINAIKAIKSAAKYVYGAVNQYFHLIFPVLAENLKDIDLRIRYAAERTFKYLCEGPSTGGSNLSSIGSNAFQQYLNRVDGELKRLLTDYQRRSVGLVSAESEEES